MFDFVELERLKLIVVKGTVSKPNLTFNELRCLGRSSEGLVHGKLLVLIIYIIVERDSSLFVQYFFSDDVRKFLWPKLLRLPDEELDMLEEELETVYKLVDDEIYQQILKDVARSGCHMPEDTSEDTMEMFQKELTQIICWVLSRHPELKLVKSFFFQFCTLLLAIS